MVEMDASEAAEEELGRLAAPNGRYMSHLLECYIHINYEISDQGTLSDSSLEAGSSSIRDDTEDVEEQPLVRHRSRRMPPGSVEPSKEVGPSETSTPSSPGEQDMGDQPSHDGGAFPSDEVSSLS